MTAETNKEELPWDVKTLDLSLGGPDDENGFVKFRVFNDERFSIHVNENSDRECDWSCEDIHLDAARRLRNFLNWAIPEDVAK